MPVTVFVAYAIAVFVAAVTPGPTVFALISSGVSRGTQNALAFAVGIAVSDVAMISIVLVGLTVVAQTFGWFFVILKYAGAVYLVVLGYHLWRTAGRPVGVLPAVQRRLTRQFLVGAAIAFGNPKALLFHVSLTPLLLDIHHMQSLDYAIVVAIVLTVDLVTMGGYAVLSGTAGRWFRTTRAVRLMNRTAGSVMIGSGVFIATRA
jgi:threonine/homoserine/homoserine lactone efflux protein